MTTREKNVRIQELLKEYCVKNEIEYKEEAESNVALKAVLGEARTNRILNHKMPYNSFQNEAEKDLNNMLSKIKILTDNYYFVAPSEYDFKTEIGIINLKGKLKDEKEN